MRAGNSTNIDVTVDLNAANTRLGEIPGQVNKAVRFAVNDTAKQARSRLTAKIRETYTVKLAGLNKALQIKNATNRNLTAHITGEKRHIPLHKYKYKKNVPGKGGRAVFAMKKKSSSMDELIHPGTKAKAFIAKVRAFNGRDNNGNTVYSDTKTVTGIFQRESANRGKIRLLYGDSVGQMLVNEDVYGIVRPDIESDLKRNLERHIRRLAER